MNTNPYRSELIVIIFFVILTITIIASINPPKPYCPEEDSCIVDYSNGQWTIYEVSP